MADLTTRRMFLACAGAILVCGDAAMAAPDKKKTVKRRKRPGRRVEREPPNLDPAGILTRIYQRAMKDVDGRVVTLSFIKEDRPRNFSAALVALWEKADASRKGAEDIGPIDFDPVTNSQGLMVKSFALASEKQDETSALLAVTIESSEVRESPGEKTIRYAFTHEDGRWKIDDISGIAGGKAWSIKELLTRFPNRR